jgi:cyclopropane fatty-acyl-phospholipid synthase-like methyltransferase
MSHAEPLRDKSVLDVGCGTGQYAVEFARRGARRVLGIDIAPNMLEVSRHNVRAAGCEDRCEFQQSDLLEYRSSETFDVTIGIGLFDYIRDPLPVLRRMHEVTSGRVIISVPRSNTWRAPVRKARLAMRGCDVYFYSQQRTVDLLQEAGFKNVDIESVGKLYCATAFVVGP